MQLMGDISRRTGVTYHHQLYTLLLRAIGAGEIAAGSALPSEIELMRRFKVSRNTVRRALGRLELEKHIIRRRGSGSYARSAPRNNFTPEALAQVLLDVSQAGESQTKAKLLRVSASATPEYIRRRDPAFGEESVMVQRCRVFRDEPFMFSTSHVPSRFAKDLTRKVLVSESVLMALDRLGIRAASAEQTTTAVPADAMAAKHLGVELSSPLLSLSRLIRNADGKSIEYQTVLCRPDRYDLRANVSLERTSQGLAWQYGDSADLVPAWL